MRQISTIWSKSFVFLIMVSLITAMGFNMVYVLISNYALEIKGSLPIAGMISGIFSIAALIVRPFAGMSVDLFNKKRLCIIANAFIGISVLGYYFSFNIPVLFLFRVLHGVAFGLGSTANVALVTGFIPKERLGEGLGYYGIGQVIAQIIGPNLGVYIAKKAGYGSLFLVIVGLSVLAIILLCLFPYTYDQNKGRADEKKLSMDSFFAKEAVLYAAIGGVFSFSNGIVSSYLLLFSQERGIHNIGLFFSVGAIVLFILRLFVGKLIDKQDLTIVVNISLILMAISMGVIGFAPILGWLIFASVLKALGQGAGQISLQSACVKSVTANRIGVATSTFYIGADIGQGIGPMIGGKIADSFNYTVMFTTCAVLMLLSMVIFDIYSKKRSNIET